ncbi:hypothetical protein WICMUC_000681 [Wickerhamomyces mucosus]|uniref:SET domain-containing protein n=1 Tax=Wickerhamomyces mucosus TaxID=1378264 RepID=A0A9P8THN4_9ASCO|nr:hypothetical protein WICMUC_000681 [Wickerhamomyces mucosus]
MPASTQKLQSLLDDFRSAGGFIDKNISFEFSDSKGIHAIYTGEQNFDLTKDLIKVPEDYTISVTLAEELFGLTIVPTGNRNVLLLFLLAKLRFDPNDTIINDVNVSQKFRSYIDILPTGREIGSPLFWTAEERDLIWGTDVVSSMTGAVPQFIKSWYTTVSKFNKNILPGTAEEDFKFYENFKTSKDFKQEQFVSYYNQPQSWTSFPAYLWAFAILTSRGFPLFINPDKKAKDVNEAFLLPIFDLLNHDNKSKVEWELKDENYTFKVKSELSKGQEVLNSYGPKNNETLLLNYGFVLEKNDADNTGISLRIPDDLSVVEARSFGLDIKSHEVSYKIDHEHKLPIEFVNLLAFLVKTKEEKTLTLRNQVKGLKQLLQILTAKIEILKNQPVPQNNSINGKYIKNAKIYKNTQRQFFQTAFEDFLKVEKDILKKYKPLSFKTVFKNDKRFASALLLAFGIDSYEKLSKTDDINHAILLWLIRVGNKKHYPQDERAHLPDWIHDKYVKLLQTTKITANEVHEFTPYYNSLFPKLAENIPEIFAKGDWNLRAFVIAEKLVDEIVVERQANNEMFILHDLRLQI